MINLESLESPFVVPLMITCPNDHIQLVSTSIPNSIQENESFIINLEKLSNWKGVSADDNGAWTLKGSRCRSYSVKNDGDGRFVALNKTGQKHTNIVVCWTPNVCKSCPEFHIRTKESTKQKLTKNFADVKFNIRRAFFLNCQTSQRGYCCQHCHPSKPGQEHEAKSKPYTWHSS